MIPRARCLSLAAIGCFVLAAGNTGCALRATTDFGPQSPSSTRSLSAGPEGLPGGISGVSSPAGEAIGLRQRGGDAPAGGGSPVDPN